MGQLLLLSDPRPLDERLGPEFFRAAPQHPGVYLMRDAQENVLYVGKAKNLRQRLRSYRIANPDKMPRRHLRLLRQVARIELQLCPDETAALAQESNLLRSLKPRYNRAGVWPGKIRFVAWRATENRLELAVTEIPQPSWQSFGPLGASSRYLHQTLCRLLWLALNFNRAYAELPNGWVKGKMGDVASMDCGQSAEEIIALLAGYFGKASDTFLAWLETRLAARTHVFERSAVESEMESLKEFSLKLRVLNS
jgi:excinuclease UvrABC nuclease subunit